MIIRKYLTKEILNTFLAVTLVLLLIFLSNALVRYLSYAAMGKLGANILFRLISFEIPYLLSLLMPLGLYLGIILAYGRLYADSEMRIMHACGLSISRLIRITSVIIICITVLALILTLWVNPWIATQKQKLILQSLTISNILENLTPGRFQVSNDGKRVLYVERISRNHKQANNIFMADQKKEMLDVQGRDKSSWTVLSADNGLQINDPITHNRFIVATNGYRYDGTPGQNDFRIIQFKKYAVTIPTTPITSKRQQEESIPTSKLWQKYNEPQNAAELQWRLSIPLATLILGLLAIPLSQVHPRKGRYSQLFLAVLIYIIYVNLLFIARSWTEEKFLPIHVGLWWIHLVTLFLASLLLINQRGWKQLIRRRT